MSPNLHRWRLAKSADCGCGLQQTINHIVNMHPSIKYKLVYNHAQCKQLAGDYGDYSTQEMNINTVFITTLMTTITASINSDMITKQCSCNTFINRLKMLPKRTENTDVLNIIHSAVLRTCICKVGCVWRNFWLDTLPHAINNSQVPAS